MSTEHVLPKWFLETAAEHQGPPEDLGSVASTFLGTLYTDRQWSVVQQELEQLSRNNSIAGILRRQEEALLGIANVSRWEAPDPAKIAAIRKARENNERSLAAELKAAEEEFRARMPRLPPSFRRQPRLPRRPRRTRRSLRLPRASPG